MPPARRPAILAVDDEPAVLAAVARDLRRGFGERYRILRAGSAAEALETLTELRRRGDQVALLIADQRMPGMAGTEYLVQARTIVPDAKRVLLTAYADTEAAIQAINEVGLDYYLLKPWDPPEEQLYPPVEDLLTTWDAGAALTTGGVRIIGHRFSKASHDLRDFLARNRVPARWFDVERDGEARELDFGPLGGAYARIAPDATAYAHRDARFMVKHSAIVDVDAAAAAREAARAWSDGSHALLHAHGTGGVYQNFPEPGLDDWPRAYYAGNVERLVAIGDRDADQLLHHGAHVFVHAGGKAAKRGLDG